VIRGETATGDDGFVGGAAVDAPLGGGCPVAAPSVGETRTSCPGVGLTPLTIAFRAPLVGADLLGLIAVASAPMPEMGASPPRSTRLAARGPPAPGDRLVRTSTPMA